jgi:predicted TIM-barrel enzyme
MTPSRAELVARFQEMKRQGVPIVGGGAGTGLSAKCEEAGGIDLIVIYNSGRFRMAGRGSLAGLLAYGDANAIVMDMAREVLPVVKHTPVLAGVNGTDPFRMMDRFLDDVKRAGFAGVQNFPTVGLIDGVFRENLEETGMSYALEVDMIRLAAEKDLLTTPYVFCEEDAEAMAKAGADIVVVHLGLTTGGAIGAETAVRLEDCPGMIDAWAAAALSVNPDVVVLVHGGPVAMPDDVSYVLKRTRHCHGFYGASSMERIPTEQALTEQVRAFKRITLRPAHEAGARRSDPSAEDDGEGDHAGRTADVSVGSIRSTPAVEAPSAGVVVTPPPDVAVERVVVQSPGDAPVEQKRATRPDEAPVERIVVTTPGEAPVESVILRPSLDEKEPSRTAASPAPAAPLMRPAHVPPVREDKLDPDALRLYEEHRDINEVFRILHARGFPINDIAWKTGRSYQEVYRTVKEEERKKRGQG